MKMICSKEYVILMSLQPTSLLNSFENLFNIVTNKDNSISNIVIKERDNYLNDFSFSSAEFCVHVFVLVLHPINS